MMWYQTADAVLRGHALLSSVARIDTASCPGTRRNQKLAGRPESSRRR